MNKKHRYPNFHDNTKKFIHLGAKYGDVIGESLKIAGDISTATGEPEIGIPLLAASKGVQKGTNLLKKFDKLQMN